MDGWGGVRKEDCGGITLAGKGVMRRRLEQAIACDERESDCGCGKAKVCGALGFAFEFQQCNDYSQGEEAGKAEHLLPIERGGELDEGGHPSTLCAGGCGCYPTFV